MRNGTGRRDRLNELDRLYTEKETEMHSRRTELKQLAEQLGTGDTEALALKQQIVLQSTPNPERNSPECVPNCSVPRTTCKSSRPGSRPCKPPHNRLPTRNPPARRSQFDPTERTNRGYRHPPGNHSREDQGTTVSKLSAEYAATKKALAEKVEKRRKRTQRKVAKDGPGKLDPQIVELKSRIEILVAQEKAAVKDLDEQRQKAEHIGNSSIDVEMMRSELQYLDKVLAPIADEREKLKVELRSTPAHQRLPAGRTSQEPRQQSPPPKRGGGGLRRLVRHGLPGLVVGCPQGAD